MPHSFVTPHTSQARLLSQPNGWAACRNLNLLLHQYIPREVIGAGGPEKGRWLTELARRTQPRSPAPLFDDSLHKAWLSKWSALVDARRAIQFEARCGWRMVVGLGGPSPAETDLHVHPVFGIPYIPGSALKGLTRAYVEIELKDTGDEMRASALRSSVRDADVERVFGAQERSGSVIFFDAVPERGLQLDVDVINPHYPDYYRDATGKHPPSDDQNPIPVHFLTVGQATFRFAVAPRGRSAAQDDAHLTVSWLKSALRDYGVGAKTSAGYGRFAV